MLAAYERRKGAYYEQYPIKDAALLMTSANSFFWVFQQAAPYYQFAIANCIGFTDKGMFLTGAAVTPTEIRISNARSIRRKHINSGNLSILLNHDLSDRHQGGGQFLCRGYNSYVNLQIKNQSELQTEEELADNA